MARAVPTLPFPMSLKRKNLGHGVGLRSIHYPAILGGAARGRVGFFEAISENYMIPGGRALSVLEAVRRDFPLLLHGVSLSIGSSDPINRTYLAELAALCDRIQPEIVSDHLCWGSIHGRYAHDLLPLPFTEESLALTARHVGEVQEALGTQILLENVSSYLELEAGEMTEWQFLAELAERTDCGILLDVNNVYVTAFNHGFDARTYLGGIPRERVGQMHLAGHQDRGRYLFDAHDRPVIEPVWQLYREAVARFGEIPTLIEWDEAIPELPKLLAESTIASRLMREVLDARHSPQAA
jgi:uncharacterized protein (UPF0276 family)